MCYNLIFTIIMSRIFHVAYFINEVKSKVKIALEQAKKAPKGSRGTALFFL